MHKDNLILMDRYHFFASSCQQFGLKCKSLSQLTSDESEIEGVLSSVLRVLRQIHHIFFDVCNASSLYWYVVYIQVIVSYHVSSA